MNQRELEESIEKMGVTLSKHPNGTLTVSQGGEFFTIFPHEKRWTFRVRRFNEVNPYQTGFFARKDVDLMVHKVLTWAWKNGAQAKEYRV